MPQAVRRRRRLDSAHDRHDAAVVFGGSEQVENLHAGGLGAGLTGGVGEK
jgi:hypothetical protein